MDATHAETASYRRRPRWLVATLIALAVIGLVVWWRLSIPEPVVPEGRRADRRNEPPGSTPETSPPSRPLPTPSTPESPTALLEEARVLGERLLQRFPGDAGAMAARARVEYQLGRTAVARDWWRRSVDADSNYAPAYRGLALVAADQGDYARATPLRRKVLDLEPTSTGARTELAEAFLKLGEPQQVVNLLGELDHGDPSTPKALYLRGQAQLQLEDYEAAERSYRAAVELQPDWDVAYYGLITVLARLDRTEESAAYMQQFQASRERIRQAKKDHRAAYDDAQLMRQDLADAYTEAGDVFARRGDLAESERLWQRAAALDAQNVASRYRLVSLYEKTGRDALARFVLEEMITLLPGNVHGHIQLGVLLARAGELDAAEDRFRAAIRVAPRFAVGYRELARLLMFANRRVAEAKDLAERAVRLEPSAESYAILGASCEMNGDVPGAIEAFEHAMRLDPQNAEYSRVHAALRDNN